MGIDPTKSRREIGSATGGYKTMLTNPSASQFHIYIPWFNAHLAYCLNSALNVKALVGAFNQEKALVGAFSVIVKTDRGTDGSFYRTSAEARSRHIVVQIL